MAAAHQWWRNAGEPGWDRLGLTATEHDQHIWLDTPDGPNRWNLRGTHT